MRPTEAPSDRTPPQPTRRVARKLAIARAIVGWERLWPSIWVPLLLIAAFFGIALLGVPAAIGEHTGGWGHLALLVGFAVAILWTARRGAVAWQPAADADAARKTVWPGCGYGRRSRRWHGSIRSARASPSASR